MEPTMSVNERRNRLGAYSYEEAKHIDRELLMRCQDCPMCLHPSKGACYYACAIDAAHGVTYNGRCRFGIHPNGLGLAESDFRYREKIMADTHIITYTRVNDNDDMFAGIIASIDLNSATCEEIDDARADIDEFLTEQTLAEQPLNDPPTIR